MVFRRRASLAAYGNFGLGRPRYRRFPIAGNSIGNAAHKESPDDSHEGS
jgi:hypothetical protein